MTPDSPTLKDIARLAGVTPGTVSRAIRGDPVVTETTKLRIMDIVRELDYRPNLAARGLRTGKIGALGLACAAGPWVLHHPYFAPMHTGFITAASGEGVRVIHYVPPQEKVRDVAYGQTWVRDLLDPQLDGCIIYQAHTQSVESLLSLQSQKLRLVLMNTDVLVPGFFQIQAGTEQRIAESVRWAADLGAKRIGVLGLSSRMAVFGGALRRGLAEAGAGFALSSRDVDHPDPEDVQALDAATDALLKDRPDAIVFNLEFHLERFLSRRMAGDIPPGVELFFFGGTHQRPPLALPGVRHLSADLLGAGSLAYRMIKEAKTGAQPRHESLVWKRPA